MLAETHRNRRASRPWREALAVACLAVAACGGGGDDDHGHPPVVGGAAPITCAGRQVTGITTAVYVDARSKTADDNCGHDEASACSTIQRGIAACSGAGCSVLVRHGLYVTIASITLRDGVSVIGSCLFDADESGGGDQRLLPLYRSLVDAQPAPGTAAVVAANLTQPTRFSGIVVANRSESRAGTASMAMAVTSSSGLSIAQTTLASGRGGDGVTGTVSPAGAGESPQGPSGFGVPGGAGGRACASNPAAIGGGGPGGDAAKGKLGFPYFCVGTCPCDYANADASAGKWGGSSGAVLGGFGASRTFGGEFCTGPSFDANFENRAGGPGNAGVCASGSAQPSADIWGAYGSGAWKPGVGPTGPIGNVGSGGGGGSSGGICVGFPDGFNPAFIDGGAGGGGGGGGCGGNGGGGGQQGGASLPLVLIGGGTLAGWANNVLVPGPGGTGGTGAKGTPGGAGGNGAPGVAGHQTQVGASYCPGNGGQGGRGGQGGAGGGGAGGNGGPSIGIARVGGAPDPNASNQGIYEGNPGAGGPGGGGGTNPNCTAQQGSSGVAGGGKGLREVELPNS